MTPVDNPYQTALERLLHLARERGFVFTPAGERGAQWGQRTTPHWTDLMFLGETGHGNAVRSRRDHVIPGEPLFTERISGPALTVLHTVIYSWPPPT